MISVQNTRTENKKVDVSAIFVSIILLYSNISFSNGAFCVSNETTIFFNIAFRRII